MKVMMLEIDEGIMDLLNKTCPTTYTIDDWTKELMIMKLLEIVVVEDKN
jgi:hypothetical protein